MLTSKTISTDAKSQASTSEVTEPLQHHLEHLRAAFISRTGAQFQSYFFRPLGIYPEGSRCHGYSVTYQGALICPE